jgi:phosphoglucomutase
VDIFAVNTKPFSDQSFGTSGIRRKSEVFRQENYLENIIQSIFNSLDNFEGKTLVIGGDGRYGNNEAIQTIIKMAVANQFGHIIVGQNGILSTPASSHMIVSRQAFGGIILSASHNPGGKNGDIGIKYDTEIGGSAQEELTNKFNQNAQQIDHYWMIHSDPVDLSRIGDYTIGSTLVEVVDSVSDYADYMAEIFDFKAIRELFKSGFKITFDAMNAVTGPYAKYIFETLLGAEAGSVIRGEPLPDFGGIHPEPNLTYAKDLVELAYSESAPDLCAASDGDGDRYMILGKSFFVNPADSLAILAENMEKIPFYKGRFYGVARSMPTGGAVDLVCQKMNKDCYQTPTGWKFFGSLLENQRISLCGEESFGAGSFHLMEKDGLWAILFWLNLIAITKKSPEQLVRDMWKKYGRIYNKTFSYTTSSAEKAHHLMDVLASKLPSLKGQNIEGLTVSNAQFFNYTDPVSQTQYMHQAILVDFNETDQVMVRLSGTVSSGASMRVYLHHKDENPDLSVDTAVEALSKAVQTLLNIPKYLGDDVEITTT